MDSSTNTAHDTAESGLTCVLASHIRQSAAQSHGSGIRSTIHGYHECARDGRGSQGRDFESAVESFFLNHSDFLAKLEDLTGIPQGPTGLKHGQTSWYA